MPAPSSPPARRRPPAAGAAVIATGVLSLGMQLAGHAVLSGILLVLACAAWLPLAVYSAVRLLRERGWWRTEAASAAGLAAVTATTVLGTRFSDLDWRPLAAALLAPAALLWAPLLLVSVRHWRRAMPGTVFLGSLATQGLALLAAALAGAEAVAWLAHAALVLFWLGLVVYGFALARFDARELVRGGGDQWIAGGALALSALAGAELIAADSARLYLWNDDDQGVLRSTTLTLLVLALAAYAAVLAAEIRWPRPRYDVRRWSTVFPMGMTAVAAQSVAAELDVTWPDGLGEVLLWVAAAAWLALCCWAVVDARGALRGPRPAPDGVRSRARR